jgi:AcrR family transcriptional regulator
MPLPRAPAPPTPRKRPRQARAQATWDAIVEAAAQLLAGGGLGALTTNAVAARAGVSIGSLYQYFPNRDAIMVALIERQQAAQVAALAAAFAGLPGPCLRDSVTIMVRAAMAHHGANPLLATAIDHEEARLPVGAVAQATLDGAGQALGMALAAHRDELGDVDLDRAATTLPQMARAVVDAWANIGPPDLAGAEQEAVRAVMGYLMWRER